MSNLSVGGILWVSFVAGIIATLGMEMLLRKITRAGWANADMVRAIGSIFTRSLDTAYRVGIIIHTISGIIFAFVYTMIISLIGVHGFLNSAAAGLLIGFIHGAVVGFILVVTVAEHHPLPEFREAGFSVALAHWGAHLLYGLLVGIVVGFMQG